MTDYNGLLIGVGAVTTAVGSIYAGIVSGRRSAKATAAATMLEAQKQSDSKETKYIDDIRDDVADLKKQLDTERTDRKITEAKLWIALNAYRVRDALWWELYHMMNKRLMDANMAPVPLPGGLQSWPEMPPAPEAPPL